MKILIGSFTLVAGGLDSDEESESSAQQLSQIGQGLRTDDAKVLPRGNRSFTFAFQKTRQHASFEEAEDFYFWHPLEIPSATDNALQIVSEDPGGGERSTYFDSHNVEEVRVRRVGCTTITTYRIIAAKPSRTAPTV